MKSNLKLYLLCQDENDGYDTYDSCVVAAESEEEARKIHPSPGYSKNWWELELGKLYATWATKLENITVRCIGDADNKIEKGVIIASFNAG
jgi:hypothetical protein